MTPTCGGCRGLGKHTRWCPAVVGEEASHYGLLSMKYEDQADRVGSNDCGLANELYRWSRQNRKLADILTRIYNRTTTTGSDDE